MSGGVFVSYRREDTQGSAGRLYDRLSTGLGRTAVFFDVDNIAPGLDFVEVLGDRVGSCDALLAVIGGHWVSIKDECGQRRLDNPNDFVRIEVEAALQRKVPVIPVLVDGARMPRADDLPDSLKGLARRQAAEVSHARFDFDAERLFKALRRILDERALAAQERQREAEAARVAEEMRRREAEEERARIAAEKRQKESETRAARAAERKQQKIEAARIAEEERRKEIETEAARVAEMERRKAEADASRAAYEERWRQIETENARIAELARRRDEAEAARVVEEERQKTEAEVQRIAEEEDGGDSEAENARIAELARRRVEAEAARVSEDERRQTEVEARRIAEEERLREFEAEIARVAESARRKVEVEAVRVSEEDLQQTEAEARRIAEEDRLREFEAEIARVAEWVGGRICTENAFLAEGEQAEKFDYLSNSNSRKCDEDKSSNDNGLCDFKNYKSDDLAVGLYAKLDCVIPQDDISVRAYGDSDHAPTERDPSSEGAIWSTIEADYLAAVTAKKDNSKSVMTLKVPKKAVRSNIARFIYFLRSINRRFASFFALIAFVIITSIVFLTRKVDEYFNYQRSKNKTYELFLPYEAHDKAHTALAPDKEIEPLNLLPRPPQISVFPEPNKVKTFVVRPDGTPYNR